MDEFWRNNIQQNDCIIDLTFAKKVDLKSSYHTHTHTHTKNEKKKITIQGDGNGKYFDCSVHFTMYVYQNINLYNLNIYAFICQIYLSKAVKGGQGREIASPALHIPVLNHLCPPADDREVLT